MQREDPSYLKWMARTLDGEAGDFLRTWLTSAGTNGWSRAPERVQALYQDLTSVIDISGLQSLSKTFRRGKRKGLRNSVFG